MHQKFFLLRPLLFLSFTLVNLMLSGFFWTQSQVLEPRSASAAEQKAILNPDSMPIYFKNIESEKLRNCFMRVYERYDNLHQYEIHIVQQRIGSSTMQAQPIISFASLFNGIKRYRVNVGEHVRDADSIKLAELPEEILIGWFAHEMGHLVDYQQHNNWQMIVYGLKYYFSHSVKRKVEHDADYIAIARGFQAEILATKRFILGDERIGVNYKSKIERYYLPEDSVMLCAEDKDLLEPYLEL